MAERGVGLVYGGGAIGLMGEVADAVLAGGGEVIGVIPRFLSGEEIAHSGLTELHVVESMHERKARMAELADGFAALPGGIGTLEELNEILTWAQLELHAKPVGVLNTAGFFDGFLAFLRFTVREGFLAEKHRRLLLSADEPEDLLQWLTAGPTAGPVKTELV
ncbi:putative cytokinin riboside 5'-monophosphate phosphoribohydrolase [Methylogaea oryzae]|uniref:Cytokinin riboside 5'-monophosphate phosphoribohydrolase n=2 Tax=Methylogaea oryzae TaxID=1295382 RepID=A0A8D4VQ85_9GAMM|nr:putative cytokinin riboside 5'-monophosphate phosphoribohydrolase [Methylogaea oryzae]